MNRMQGVSQTAHGAKNRVLKRRKVCHARDGVSRAPRKLDVCDGVYYTRYYSNGESFEQIYVKSRQRVLERCKKSCQISSWYLKPCVML